MNTNILSVASGLSDHDLLARLEALAGKERDASVELVAHLAALDTRPSVFAAQGHASLFGYCTKALRLSEDAACNRIEAARACRRFPVILDLLASGALSLTSIRKLPTPAPKPLPMTARPPVKLVESVASPSEPTLPIAPPVPSVPSRRPLIDNTSRDRYRVQFTMGKESHDRLRRVQALLRREIPDGDPAAIFERALTLLLEKVEKAKLGAARKPRPPRPIRPGTDWQVRTPVIHPRDVPRHVQRAICRRDADQCAFVSKDGQRCTERTFLEFHHIRPYAQGGQATIENISLRCRRHNQYEAELVFGPRGASSVRAAPGFHHPTRGVVSTEMRAASQVVE